MNPAPTPQAGELPTLLSDHEIRDIFLRNGFTIKVGHADLKDYVFAAARAIETAVIARQAIAAALASQPEQPIAEAQTPARASSGDHDLGLRPSDASAPLASQPPSQARELRSPAPLGEDAIKAAVLDNIDWERARSPALAVEPTGSGLGDEVRLLRMVLDDIKVCYGELGADWIPSDLSTETVDALAVYDEQARERQV